MTAARVATGLGACALAWGLLAGAPPPAAAATHFLVIEGLGGTRTYSERFREQVVEMLPVLRSTAGSEPRGLVLAGVEATAERIGSAFGDLAGAVAPGDSLAVFLIGHGTHDGRDYKFNIPGPDVTGKQLALWLDSVPAASQLVVCATSSSGGALETLRSPRRVVVTATKNGRERTATVFGKYWAESLTAADADTDKNDGVSALEAFRYAESKVKSHYADQQQLATEHPVLEGERAESFLLARLGAAAAMADDPSKRPLLDQREDLERQITDLRRDKDDLDGSEYLDALEALLLRLAELQERIDEDAGGERP